MNSTLTKYKLEKCDAPIRIGEKTTERHTKERMLIVWMGLKKFKHIKHILTSCPSSVLHRQYQKGGTIHR